MQVTLAGSPPNCLFSLLKTNFGYAQPSATADEEEPPCKRLATSTSTSDGISTVPKHMRPRAKEDYHTLSSFHGSESKGTDGNFPSAEVSRVTGFKPCSNPKHWSRTGLANDYEPKQVEDEENYSCPFPLCNYAPKQKFDAVATHIRCHLNIAIQCHYCNKLFWSCAGWTKHCSYNHSNLSKVLEDAADLGTFQPLAEPVHFQAIKEEEQAAVSNVAALAPVNYDVEPPIFCGPCH